MSPVRPRARRPRAAPVPSAGGVVSPRGLLAPVLVAVATRAWALAPVPALAAPARSLSWQDCVALALQRNPDLASAARASESSRAGYLGSFNALLPSLTLSNSVGSGSSSNGHPSYEAAATADVSLFDMGKVAGIRTASAAYDQTLASLRQASAGVRFSLRQTYASVLFAETSVGVATRILDIRRHGAEMVTLRYQSGHEYKGNMMNAQAQQLQAEASLAQARRELRASRRALDRQLGLDEFEEVTATGDLVAQEPPVPPARMLDLLEARPDVALQEAVLRGAKAALASSESSLWPSLTASYSRTRGSSGLLGAASPEFPSSPYGWSAGAT